MRKRINKILWYGDELLDEKAKAPGAATSADGLDGLNEGEIYISNNEKDPALFIRTSSGKVVRVGVNYEELKKMFLSKIDDDTAQGLINFEKGVRIKNLFLHVDEDVLSLTNIENGKRAHFAASGAVSSLGVGEDEGGTGGTAALYQLVDVLADGDKVSGAEDGNVLMFDAATGKWYGKKVNLPEVDFSEINDKFVSIDGLIESLQEKDVAHDESIIAHGEAITALQTKDAAIEQSVTSLQGQFDTLVSGDASSAIESFNEVVEFLKDIEDDSTLEGILAGKQNKITETNKLDYSLIANTPSLADFMGSSAIGGTASSENFSAVYWDGTQWKTRTIYKWALASVKPSYTTSDVTEGTRLYFTDDRAKTALKSTTDALSARIAVFEKMFQWGDGDGSHIKTPYALASDSTVSSLGVGSDGTGSLSYDRLDSWDSYTDDKAGYVLSAALGWDLKTRLDNLDIGDFDLSGYLTKSEAENTYATIRSLNSGLARKQETITDLATIREGAALGATALQSFTESDPVFKASAAYAITSTNITNWNAAYGWGNHAEKGYLVSSDLDGVTSAIQTQLNALSARIKAYEDILKIEENNTLLHATVAFASDSTVSSLGVGSDDEGNIGGVIDLTNVVTNIVPSMDGLNIGSASSRWSKLYVTRIENSQDDLYLDSGGYIRMLTDVVFGNNDNFSISPTGTAYLGNIYSNGNIVATLGDIDSKLSGYALKSEVYSGVISGETENGYYKIRLSYGNGVGTNALIPSYSALGFTNIEQAEGYYLADQFLINDILDYVDNAVKNVNVNVDLSNYYTKTQVHTYVSQELNTFSEENLGTALQNYFPLSGNKTITGKVTISSAGFLEVQGNVYVGGTLYSGLSKNNPYATQDWVESQGYTSNIGTVTGVRINGSTKNPSSGIVDLGYVASYEDIANVVEDYLVTDYSLSSDTTDAVKLTTLSGRSQSITTATLKNSLGLKALAYKDSIDLSAYAKTSQLENYYTKDAADSAFAKVEEIETLVADEIGLYLPNNFSVASNTTNAVSVTIGSNTENISAATLKTSLGLGEAAYKAVGAVASGNTGLVTGGSVYTAIKNVSDIVTTINDNYASVDYVDSEIEILEGDLAAFITATEVDTKLQSYATQTWVNNNYQTKITSSNKLAYSLISGTPTSLPASDVYSWAKAASKPSYSWNEITGKPTIPTKTSQLTNDSNFFSTTEDDLMLENGIISTMNDEQGVNIMPSYISATSSTGTDTFKVNSETGNTVIAGTLSVGGKLVATTDDLDDFAKKATTLSGYGITDGVWSNAIDLSSTSLASYNGLQDWADNNPSFIGSLYDKTEWHNVMSVRHRNGIGDGNKYGMVLYSRMTVNGASLKYIQNINGVWDEKARTILDSSNFSNYALPLTGGEIKGSLGVTVNITAQGGTFANGLKVGGNTVATQSWVTNNGYATTTSVNNSLGSLSAEISAVDARIDALGTAAKKNWSGASSADTTNLVTIGWVESKLGGYATAASIPTKTSQLTNDSNFVSGSIETTVIGGGTGLVTGGAVYSFVEGSLSGYAKKATTLSGYGITDALPKSNPSVAGTLTVAGNVLPSANDTHALGSTNYRWSKLYANGVDCTGTISSTTNISAQGNVTAINGGLSGKTLSVSGAASVGSLTVGGAVHSNLNIGGYRIKTEGGDIYGVYDGLDKLLYFDASAAFCSAFVQTSDERLKNILNGDFRLSLGTMANAPLVQFDWNNRNDGKHHVGTIAQYWEGCLPEVVSRTKGGTLALGYGELGVAMGISLANILEDTNGRVASVEEEIKALKEENKRLKERVAELEAA